MGVADYFAEGLAGHQVDDLRPRKDEKSGNVKHCERFSAGLQIKRKRTHSMASTLVGY